MGIVKKRKVQKESSGSAGSSKKVEVATQCGRNNNKKLTIRKFRPIWLEVKAFKEWLASVPGNEYKAQCKMCNESMIARYSVLKKHAKSNGHIRNCGFKTYTEIDFAIPKREECMQEREKARAELKLVALCADVNLSFKSLPKILSTFQSISNEDYIKKIRLGKTKARDLLVNVIGKCVISELDEVLRTTKFSICVDESTDRSKDKSLAIIVRFINLHLKKTESRLWRLVPVLKKGQKANAGAERLFTCITEQFKQSSIPLENVVACCFDGCTTMIGEKSGLKRRLTDAIPGIVCVQCPAHSTHLCAQYAVQELPSEVILFITSLYNLLNSSHKLHNFKELQVQKLLIDLGFPQFKILKQCSTRWLILEQCVNRIIDLWPVVVLFIKMSSQDKDNAGKKMADLLNTPNLKLYFLVLRQTLHDLNSLNTLFQRAETVLDVAKENLEKCYKNIVSCILKKEYVRKTPAKDINIFDSTNYLRFVDLDFGEEVRDALLKDGDNMETFCKCTFNYIIELSLQIRERFHNLEHAVYNLTECLKIENALSMLYHQKYPEKFGKLMTLYKKLVEDENKQIQLQMEWDNLPNVQLSKEITQMYSVINFWIFIQNLEDNKGLKQYTKLANFMLDVLTTPHANADPERTFSELNNCKTKNRNSLDVGTAEASLRVRQFIKLQNEFEPTENMIAMTLSSKFYTYKPPKKVAFN